MLTLNLRMDATYIKESMQIKWIAETGLVENIKVLVKEFKAARNLVVSCLLTTTRLPNSV